MPYIAPEVITEAKRMDLLTYLREYEPNELVKYSNNRLTIYSMDAAGNVNENIDESKKAEISFGIDKTNPVIVPIDFESGKQYPVEVKNVKAEVKDNLVLESVKIYLNGEEVEYKVDGFVNKSV